MKKAWASDSRPVVPTSRFRPIAPTIAPNTAKAGAEPELLDVEGDEQQDDEHGDRDAELHP